MTSVQGTSPTHLRGVVALTYDEASSPDDTALCGFAASSLNLTLRLPHVTCSQCLVELSTVVLNRYAYLAVSQRVE